MRLSDRRNVDLPQPEGPINAITEHSGISSEMSKSACFLPYQKDRLRTTNLVRVPFGLVISRPFWLRSEMMAEYDRVDIRPPESPPVRDGTARPGGILGVCREFLMKSCAGRRASPRYTCHLREKLPGSRSS